MSKKDSFKAFAKTHPELVSQVKSGKESWQSLFEVYDIYGEDESAWAKYLKEEESGSSFKELGNMVKNIDMDSIQKHINTAQKALNFVSELTTKGASNISDIAAVKGPVTPRPLNKFFED